MIRFVAAGIVLTIGLATPVAAFADDDGPRPAVSLGAGAVQALETCIQREFVLTDINDDEIPNPRCALTGARVCSMQEAGETTASGDWSGPVLPDCARAEYDWWLERMDRVVATLSARLEQQEGNPAAATLLRASQATWRAHAETLCAYQATARGAQEELCLAFEASLRGSWLLTWAGEF